MAHPNAVVPEILDPNHRFECLKCKAVTLGAELGSAHNKNPLVDAIIVACCPICHCISVEDLTPNMDSAR
jgi:hypothetical protein